MKRGGNSPRVGSATALFGHPGAPVVPPLRAPGRRQSLVWSLGISLGVLLLTLLVLLGWFLGIDSLVRILPSFPAMVPSTAINLALIAVAHLVHLTSPNPRLRQLAVYFAAAAGIYAAFRLGLQVAYLLISTPLAPIEAGDSMAFGTALGLMMASFCVSTQAVPDPQIRRIARGMATTGLLMTLLAVDGYLFNAQLLFSIFAYTSMALHTALCLFALFLAVLLAHPEHGWVSTLLGRGPGSRLAQRMVPIVVIGPTAVCVIAILADPASPGERAFLLVALTLLLVTLTLIAVLRCAARENSASQHDSVAQEQMQMVLDGLPTAIFVLDQLGDVRLFNGAASRLAGQHLGPERWLYETRFHMADSRAALRPSERPASRLLQDPDLGEITVAYFDENRTERAVNFAAGRTSDALGEPLWIIAVTDETDAWTLKTHAAPAPLPQVQDPDKGASHKFIHDISNIFGVIRLSADTGALARDESAKQRHFAAIRAACDRGVRLITPGQQPEQATMLLDDHLALAPLLRQATDLARHSLPAGAELTLAPLPEGIMLACDREALRRALLTLINAAHGESRGQSSRITVSARPERAEVSIQVAGNAPDSFASGRTTAWLSAVEEFLEQAGGRLVLHQAPEAGGSAAALILPCTHDAATSDTASLAADAPRTLEGLRLLVAEDDPLFGDVLTDSLRMLGAHIAWVDNGADALALARTEEPFDMLITDIRLAGDMNGYVLARDLGRLWPDLAVIYLSGQATPPSAEMPGQVMPGTFLRKPVGVALLTETIARLRESRQTTSVR